MALFHGSSAVIGVRLNKNPAELAAAKIVPPPKMFKNYVYSLIESPYYDIVLKENLSTQIKKERLFRRSLL